jgi:hypothetical protein
VNRLARRKGGLQWSRISGCRMTKSPAPGWNARRFINVTAKGRRTVGRPTRQCCRGIERIRASGPAEAFLSLATSYRWGARRK